jgi:hypothetical protein
MKSPTSIALIAALGCAAAPPPAPKVEAPDNGPHVVIAETTPARGARLEAGTHVKVVAEYSVQDLQSGKDRLTVVLKATGGKTWEPAQHVLTKPQGRITFDFLGADLLKQPALTRPIQLLVVLDRAEPAGENRVLRASPVIDFAAEPVNDKGVKTATNLLPPNLGLAQLKIDPVRDPRYRPQLPPELSNDGVVYSALFKMCVDTEGAVYEVTLLKSAHPKVDGPWAALLRTWPHKPYTLSGVPVAYCYPVRVKVPMWSPQPPRK